MYSDAGSAARTGQRLLDEFFADKPSIVKEQASYILQKMAAEFEAQSAWRQPQPPPQLTEPPMEEKSAMHSMILEPSTHAGLGIISAMLSQPGMADAAGSAADAVRTIAPMIPAPWGAVATITFSVLAVILRERAK